jgi:hypothetical protein
MDESSFGCYTQPIPFIIMNTDQTTKGTEITEEDTQSDRLVTVLESLESLTKKQVSIKFIFLKGTVYGLGTVIGATVLISIVSFFFVQIFGVQVIDPNAVENLQEQVLD